MLQLTTCSMQELLDMGLSESILAPIRKTASEVEGVEVLNPACRIYSIHLETLSTKFIFEYILECLKLVLIF